MWLAVAYMYRACQKLYPIPYRLVDLIASVVLAWTVIGVATFIPNPGGWVAFAIRALLALTFVPLAFALGLVRPSHVRRALEWLRARTRLAPGEG
jgi:hypothetical protein